MKGQVRKSKTAVPGLKSIGGEGEEGDNKTEGDDETVERGAECRTLSFLRRLSQNDQDSLLKKNCVKGQQSWA